MVPFIDTAAPAMIRGGYRHAVLLAAAVAMLGATPARAEDYLYTVRPGDNPWNLTERYLRDLRYWPRLLQYNRITDATQIQPGSTLRIPSRWLGMRAAEMRIGQMRGAVHVRDDHRGDPSGSSDSAAAWRPAQEGQALSVGQRLRTGADGSATLELSGGTVVLMRPDSELKLIRAS